MGMILPVLFLFNLHKIIERVGTVKMTKNMKKVRKITGENGL